MHAVESESEQGICGLEFSEPDSFSKRFKTNDKSFQEALSDSMFTPDIIVAAATDDDSSCNIMSCL